MLRSLEVLSLPMAADWGNFTRAELEELKQSVVGLLAQGNVRLAIKWLAELKFRTDDPEQESLLSCALHFVLQCRYKQAVQLLDNREDIGAHMLMHRVISGRDIGTLHNIPRLPLDIVGQFLQASKPDCARQLAF